MKTEELDIFAEKPHRKERELWAAVVLQAVTDAQQGCQRAAHWLNDDRGLFVELAESLCLNARAIRDKARPAQAA